MSTYAPQPENETSRRVYEKPELVRFGDIRELTEGGAGGNSDELGVGANPAS